MDFEEHDPDSFEWAARALHETLRGDGSWGRASTQQRSQSRQALRNALRRMIKHGWLVDQKIIPLKPAHRQHLKP